ncbi:DnaB-like helicase C-terminal domain-containing protein, partial [Streptomyces sp. NPDC005349]|uniref:DnaB-like helicase C-terminal domain-containing protein n=1 Tax=Streptomyces sp. NPDC005349 TaxID=3157037 RepID=UPI0033B68E3D
MGGSLLGLAAARKTALIDHDVVLYAASGPNRDDIFRRIIAAETGGDYPRLKQGRLTEHEQQVAQQLGQAPLMIDDGSDLTAEAIAETAPHVQDLALVVVDRLQAADNARLPLSGDRLPGASQALAALARTLHVPVLAVVDSTDHALLNLLDADVLVTLAATADPAKVQVTVSERDLGTIGSTYLQPDMLHARFVDAPHSGAKELAEAALPYTSGAQKGLPAEATHTLSALRDAVIDGDDAAVAHLTASLVSAFAKVTRLPADAEGRRLAQALSSYDPALRAHCPALQADGGTETVASNAVESPAPAAHGVATPAPAAEDTQEPPDDVDEEDTGGGLVPGDEEDEPEGHVFPALKRHKSCASMILTLSHSV